MADIDLLKVWESGKKAGRSEEISVDLEKATRGKSRSTLRWISIILWIELGLNVVMVPIVYTWWNEIGLSWQFWVFLGIVVIYLVYYAFLIRAIHQFDFAVNVREGLRRIVSYLRFYLLHYKAVIWVLFPLSYCYGIYVGLSEDGFPELTTKRWLTLISISVAANAAFSGLFNWLVNLLYGRKIKRLKDMVSELEASE